MRFLFVVAMLACVVPRARADTLYEQSPSPAGGSFMSAWWDPDGSNYDRYVWDAFTIPAGGEIRAIQWRGTFGASGAPTDFTVGVYRSIPAGTQPDVSGPPLFEYQVGGDAGQTFAGTFGGAPMYDYGFTLPVPFVAQAGVKYWLQVEAWQTGFPDWSIAAASSGDGSHFLCEHNNLAEAAGVPTGCWFTVRTGDAAFTLLDAPPAGVGDPGAAVLALHGVAPNPSAGERLAVSFTLPDATPARLALYDVAGRCVRSVEVGGLGAGRHLVDLAAGPALESGIYFLRLVRSGARAATTVIVAR